MGLIALEGMRFFAYHGVYEEEQTIGNNFLVDIYIETDTRQAGKEDNIEKAINYETVYLLCQNVMKEKNNLLEKVARRIISSLKFQFGSIQKVRVRITKEHPTLGGRTQKAFVEEEDTFVRKCPRCGSSLICYQDENCWCQTYQIHSATLETLNKQYGSCLCKQCLAFYAG